MATRLYIVTMSLLLATCFADSIPKDVLFMIDGSGSVKPHNFQKLLVFIQNIAERLNIGPNKTNDNVALIQFSSRELTKVEFNLNAYHSKDGVRKAIRDVEYQQKYTYTGHALKLASKKVFNGRDGDRPDAKNILLLFTDGESADPHTALAETTKLKTRGTHVMSVGFGPKKSVAKFKHELEELATTKGKDVFVRGIDDMENIERRLREAVQPKLDCSTFPCKNDATCENTEDSFSCFCTDDYEGYTCEKKKGPCTSKPCLNDGACREEGESFKCICGEKFHGTLCEKEKVVCTTRNSDILFVMDGSRSIKDLDFDIMKDFATELVNRFNISRHESHVAMIQYSNKETVNVEFHLDDHYDKDSIMKAIKDIKLQNGDETYTDVALKVAREDVFNGARGDRKGVRDVIVLLTDGQAHKKDAAIREAGMLKDDDVSIISIGVGKGEKIQSFIDLLQGMASHSDFVFKVSFAELDTILDSVIKAACENLRDAERQ